jgi:glycosyltransferase involved in cell wall biosynthesis
MPLSPEPSRSFIESPIEVTGLYICYWSFRDPLCQTQSLAYLLKLAALGYRFALITFEQEPYALDATEVSETKKALLQQGIRWFPLTYHKRFPMLATAYDCLLGVLTGLYICWRYRPKIVHSRSSIAAAMALAIATVGRLKFLYDADARLSEEYADNGHWSRQSRAFRLTAWVEAWARQRAQAIVVLSERLRADFRQEFGVSSPIEVIPCCVDLKAFGFDAADRDAGRRELGIGDEKLFVYVGKTGPRYLVDETFAFFKQAQERIGQAFLLILSAEDPERFHRIAERQGVDRDDYCVRYASRAKVNKYLSASDAGLAFIRSAPCERGSSPIKIGEYLATGLPVVITVEIGDYSQWIAQHELGAVPGNLTPEDFNQVLDRLQEIWATIDSFRDKSRKFAETTVSIDSVALCRYARVYDALLGSCEEATSGVGG